MSLTCSGASRGLFSQSRPKSVVGNRSHVRRVAVRASVGVFPLGVSGPLSELDGLLGCGRLG